MRQHRLGEVHLQDHVGRSCRLRQPWKLKMIVLYMCICDIITCFDLTAPGKQDEWIILVLGVVVDLGAINDVKVDFAVPLGYH